MNINQANKVFGSFNQQSNKMPKSLNTNVENHLESPHILKSNLHENGSKVPLRPLNQDMNNTLQLIVDDISQSVTKTFSIVTTDEGISETEKPYEQYNVKSTISPVINIFNSSSALPKLNILSTSESNYKYDLRENGTAIEMNLRNNVIEQNTKKNEDITTISVPLDVSTTILPPPTDKFTDDSIYTTTVINSLRSKTVSPKIKNSNIQTTLIGAENPILTQNNVSFYFNDFSSSVVLAVGLSFAFALLLFVVMTLWILRRRKYHNKVYLSYELAKPSRYISKPLPPSILPGEILLDNHSVSKMDSPREPLHPIQYQQERNISTSSNNRCSSRSLNHDTGIDNPAYIGTSVGEEQSCAKNKDEKPVSKVLKKESAKNRRSLLKYAKKRKSGLEFPSPKVCSSDGSIFPASPSLTRCLVPPPPYSPSIRNESKLIFTLPNGPVSDNKSINTDCESSNLGLPDIKA